MPPVATRRGRPVWSSGTVETPEGQRRLVRQVKGGLDELRGRLTASKDQEVTRLAEELGVLVAGDDGSAHPGS